MSVGRGRIRAVRSRPKGSDWEWLVAELHERFTNQLCFDADGDAEASKMAAACRGRQPRQPAGASILVSRMIGWDCS
jgi:hypothetical protein